MLKKFFEQGLNDQIATMGEVCTIQDKIKHTETEKFKAIITEKQGETEIEVGAMTYTVNAHALIPASIGQADILGNRLKTKEGEFLICTAVKSTSDAAYSCDLVKIKSLG